MNNKILINKMRDNAELAQATLTNILNIEYNFLFKGDFAPHPSYKPRPSFAILDAIQRASKSPNR